MTEPDPDRVHRCAVLTAKLLEEIRGETDEFARAILTAAALSTISEIMGKSLEEWSKQLEEPK